MIIFAFSFAQTEDVVEMHPLDGKIELMLNNETVENLEFSDEAWASELHDESLSQISWEEGYLLLNEEDYGVWDFSHILAVRVRQTSDNSYSFDATVRHRDEGWEHYADLFRIVPANEESSVENGERVLLHPHDNEQPFTRSQSGVLATGVVCVEAKDTVHEWGGSSLCLDLTKLDFSNGPITVNWELLRE